MGPVPEQVLPGTSTGPLNKVNTPVSGGVPQGPQARRTRTPHRSVSRDQGQARQGGCSKMLPEPSRPPGPPWAPLGPPGPPWAPLGPPGPPGPPWPSLRPDPVNPGPKGLLRPCPGAPRVDPLPPSLPPPWAHSWLGALLAPFGLNWAPASLAFSAGPLGCPD